jgi:hypothetical protein
VNKSQLWGEGERNYLEDVTINLIPDDEAALGIKAKTHMKWDAKKKRYMLKKVDRDGNIVRDKKNEAGVKITAKMGENRPESIYKKWMKKTHLKLQSSGEVENTKTVEAAKNSSESRKMVKYFKARHGAELDKGEDPRSHNKVIEAKQKKMMQKIKQNGDKNKKGDKKGGAQEGRSHSEKARAKIIARSQPTRSKQIVKGKKFNKNDKKNSNSRGGKGGRR